jgi:hypothetical protein
MTRRAVRCNCQRRRITRLVFLSWLRADDLVKGPTLADVVKGVSMPPATAPGGYLVAEQPLEPEVLKKERFPPPDSHTKRGSQYSEMEDLSISKRKMTV